MQKPGGDLKFEDLSRKARREGQSYRMISGDGDDDSIVLRGGFFFARFRSGLHIHGTDAVEQMDGAAEVQLPPQLSVSVVLDGAPNAFMDGVEISTASGPKVQARLWSSTRTTLLHRHFTSGRNVRKVNVSVDPDWLSAFFDDAPHCGASLERFAATHLAMQSWSPSITAVRAAQEMLMALTHQDLLNRLDLEMRALAVIREAFATVVQADGTTQRSGAGLNADRARAAWRFIETNIREPLTLSSIAHGVGLSVSTLQRAFKDEYGVTVAKQLRASRLDLARESLAAGSLTIQQAAHIAGYGSAANFSTAFKRRFGHPPSEE